MIRALVAAMLLAAPASAQVAEGSGAVLRGLDKIDGRVDDVTVPNGGSAQFGRLNLRVEGCRFVERNPSASAFAWVVVEQGGQPIFSGWMSAASPALNALDHPRYDVWLLRCEA